MQTWRLVRVWIAVGIACLAGAARAQTPCAQVTAVMSSVTRNPVNAARVYALANLVEGDFYFSDRSTPGSHILVTIPPKYRCAQWIKTPNDDKDQTSLTLVSIQLSQPSVIYVGLDNRAAAGPTWLTSQFTDTGLSLGIFETGTQTSFRLWKRKFPTGAAVLGGNSAVGSSFPNGKSNYVVFALPDTDNDGLSDRDDNCPTIANPTQADSEVLIPAFSEPGDPAPDGVGDICDNCPAQARNNNLNPLYGRQHNGTQLDMDHDGVGDTCDDDIDGDGVNDGVDNCIYTPNPSQQAGLGAAGAACELPGGLPYEVQGLDVTQVHHFAINTDSLPPRAEVRLDFLPASRNQDVEVDVECSGDPSLQGLCAFGVGGRKDCDRFPRSVAFKVRGNTVVQPLHLEPPLQYVKSLSDPQPQNGQWVIPFFLYSDDSLFSPLPYLGIACFVEIRPYPGSGATGTFGVRISAATKAPSVDYGDEEPFSQVFFSTDEAAEYGFFTPNGTNFTLLNSGNPTLGQCVIDSPDGGGHHIAVAGARGWNCCTYTYQDVTSGLTSLRGQATIFVGTLPEDPIRPDQDGDLILDFCDNCPTVFNTNQEDADGDGKGDACDNCTSLSNATQLNTDAVPAGDGCECADVNTSNTANLADVVMMRRYLAGKTNPAVFSLARCVLAFAPFPCDPAAVLQVRKTLVGASPPLVQHCP